MTDIGEKPNEGWYLRCFVTENARKIASVLRNDCQDYADFLTPPISNRILPVLQSIGVN